jgi:hypothetical protein
MPCSIRIEEGQNDGNKKEPKAEAAIQRLQQKP